jgi:hypothetical protein
MNIKRVIDLCFFIIFVFCLGDGCAFDVSYVKKAPATFAPIIENARNFILNQHVEVGLGTGFPTRLKAGTHWHQIGSTDYGGVFITKDQIVTVEASDVYEAQLIVSNQCVTGFYLPVEKEVTLVSRPIPIVIQSMNHP